jgi:hypothetical protein
MEQKTLLIKNKDGRMSDELRDFLEGMSVLVDVSTGDHDVGNKYMGTISEIMDDEIDKNGVTLLVQDAGPNFVYKPFNELSKQEIDDIAEQVVASMPDGLRGFLGLWGWQQFAQALITRLSSIPK